jgi:hypothetical protein
MKRLACTLAFISLTLLSGCSQKTEDDPSIASVMQEIKGRDNGGPRFPVYRVKIPEEWMRRDPMPDESLIDTTKALCEFLIREDNQVIRIAVHNFPSDNINERIPPNAQVARWKRQFEQLFASDFSITPQSFNGYEGLFFIGTGIQKNEETMVLGWSLQIAPEHYRMLSHAAPAEEAKYKQMRADVTIKAVGPKAIMEKHQTRKSPRVHEIDTPSLSLPGRHLFCIDLDCFCSFFCYCRNVYRICDAIASLCCLLYL